MSLVVVAVFLCFSLSIAVSFLCCFSPFSMPGIKVKKEMTPVVEERSSLVSFEGKRCLLL